jgi:hypothetical protein
MKTVLLFLCTLVLVGCAAPRYHTGEGYSWEPLGPDGRFSCREHRAIADTICGERIVVLEHGIWTGPEPWRNYPECGSEAKKALKQMLRKKSAQSAYWAGFDMAKERYADYADYADFDFSEEAKAVNRKETLKRELRRK